MTIQTQAPYYSAAMRRLLVDSKFLLEEGFPKKEGKKSYIIHCFSDFKLLNDQLIDSFTLLFDHGNFKRKG